MNASFATTAIAAMSGWLLLCTPLAAAVDIEATSVTLSSYNSAPGGTLTVTYTRRNNGEIVNLTDTHLRITSSNSASGYGTAANNVAAVTSGPLPAGGQATSVQNITVPSTPGTYYVWLVVDATNILSETNETNNYAVSAALTVSTVDLAVQIASRFGSVPSGGAQDITTTIVNVGTSTAPPSTFQLRLNSGSPPTAADTIKTVNIPQILAGGTYGISSSLTAPVASGIYTVWGLVDPGGVVPQSNTLNDLAGVSFQVTNGTVDLQPLSPFLQATTVTTGSSFSISWTMRNNGTLPATTSQTHVLYSTSNVSNIASPLAPTFAATGAISAGASITQNATLTAPTTPGTYYLWIHANRFTNISESKVDNNEVVSAALHVAPPGVVDLQPQNVGLSTRNVSPGQPIEVTWDIRNNANTPAASSATRLRISTTNGPNGWGTAANNVGAAITTGAIAASSTLAQSASISAPATPGTYYVWVVADSAAQLSQSTTANDYAVSLSFTVGTPPTIDLQPFNLVVPAGEIVSGSTIPVSWQMRNAGNLSASSSLTQLRITTSNTDSGTTAGNVGSPLATNVVAAGATISQNTTITIPSIPGTYYVWVVSDSTGLVTQSNTANDLLVSGPLTIVAPPIPNLVPGAVALPANSIPAAENITVGWTVANTGTGAAPASVSAAWLNASATNPSAAPLSTVANVPLGTLAAGTSATQSTAVAISGALAPGTYYLWIKANSGTGSASIIQSETSDDYARSAPLTVTLPRSANRLANIATRGPVGSGNDVLIAGFVVAGTSPKPVLVRAIGPSLAAFNIAGALGNTRLQLYRGTTLLQENDDWGSNPSPITLAQAFDRVGAFGLATASLDAALLVTLDPGSYSAQVSGVGNSTGVALVEVFDASDILHPTRIANISTRALIGTGANILIAGVVVTGDAAKQVLIRAIGPTLSQFGVTTPLSDPRLELYRNTTLLDENNDWGGAAALSTAFTQVGAFALPASSRDAVLLVTLSPGSYTAQVAGVAGATGIALVEVYEIP